MTTGTDAKKTTVRAAIRRLVKDGLAGEGLSRSDTLILMLAFSDGMTAAEIAEVTGMSQSLVAARLDNVSAVITACARQAEGAA